MYYHCVLYFLHYFLFFLDCFFPSSLPSVLPLLLPLIFLPFFLSFTEVHQIAHAGFKLMTFLPQPSAFCDSQYASPFQVQYDFILTNYHYHKLGYTWDNSMFQLLNVPVIISDTLRWMSIAYMVGRNNCFFGLSFDLLVYTKPYTYRHTKQIVKKIYKY